MAKCAASDCAFLDQYQNFLVQYLLQYKYDVNSTNLGPPPTSPRPPPIVADPDIAGLGVFTDLAPLLMYTTEYPS